jgi:hypothetical protein
VNDERCENCRFFHEVSDGDGLCRKETPKFHPAQEQGDFLGHHPDTLGWGWCGEYQRKEEGK